MREQPRDPGPSPTRCFAGNFSSQQDVRIQRRSEPKLIRLTQIFRPYIWDDYGTHACALGTVFCADMRSESTRVAADEKKEAIVHAVHSVQQICEALVFSHVDIAQGSGTAFFCAPSSQAKSPDNYRVALSPPV